MGEENGQRHQRGILAACEPERGNLVSRRYSFYFFGGQLSFIKPVNRVQGKLLYAGQHAGSLLVEIRAAVSNLQDYFPGNFGEIENCLRGESGGYKDNGCGEGTLGDYSGVRVLFEEVVNYCIADDIAELVGVALRYRFRCEHEIIFHIFLILEVCSCLW